jgi:hypothetical protein
MKYKVGDTVRIQSRKWVDAQEKGVYGVICSPGSYSYYMGIFMQKYAGSLAKIVRVDEDNRCYDLDIDDGVYLWGDWMFDPGYEFAGSM